MKLKTLICLTASIAATAAFADIEVQLGVTQVNSTNKNTIVAVPYKGFEAGQNITVSNVVKTANLAAGDFCYVMRTDGSNLYDAWELKTKSGGILQWEEVNQVSVTGGVTAVVKSPSPCTTTLTPGSALWIVRNGTSRDYSVPFYLWGRYEGSAPSTSFTIPDGGKGAWVLVANAGSAAVSVDDLIAKIQASVAEPWTKYDQIVVPRDGHEVSFQRYKSSWNGTTRATTKIDPGLGCWVKMQKAGTYTVAW